ncbi:MAG: hypothetical protein V8S33_01165 [Intestinibacter bartlettii]
MDRCEGLLKTCKAEKKKAEEEAEAEEQEERQKLRSHHQVEIVLLEQMLREC